VVKENKDQKNYIKYQGWLVFALQIYLLAVIQRLIQFKDQVNLFPSVKQYDILWGHICLTPGTVLVTLQFYLSASNPASYHSLKITSHLNPFVCVYLCMIMETKEKPVFHATSCCIYLVLRQR